MVTHVVIFFWHPGVADDQVKSFGSALNRMVSQLSVPVEVSHGPDLVFRDGNGDYALIAVFPDRAAWDAYQGDPAHQAFVREVVAPLQLSRIAIQF